MLLENIRKKSKLFNIYIKFTLILIKIYLSYFILFNKELNHILYWGLGIGDWAQSPIPNPQSPIPIYSLK